MSSNINEFNRLSTIYENKPSEPHAVSGKMDNRSITSSTGTTPTEKKTTSAFKNFFNTWAGSIAAAIGCLVFGAGLTLAIVKAAPLFLIIGIAAAVGIGIAYTIADSGINGDNRKYIARVGDPYEND